VLKDGFQLVERLRELRLVRRGSFVLVPQRDDLVAPALRQHRRERHEVSTLGVALGRHARGGAARLLRRRHVSTEGFAEVVDDTQLEQMADVDAGSLAGDKHRHETEPPRMLGDALGSAGRRITAPMGRLELLSRAKKIEHTRDVGGTHLRK
jgi:hypothetical protein